jgi:hypothetical protein
VASDDPLGAHYERLRRAANNLRSSVVSNELIALCELSLDFIRQYAEMVDLISNVPGKSYAMARLKTATKSSRPINKALFDPAVSRSELELLF